MRYNIAMHNTYTEGFLDGLRYSGHLLVDVPDEDLKLTTECKNAIMEAYIARDYQNGRTGNFHNFFRRLIKDTTDLEEQNQELRQLLTEAQGVEKSKLGNQK